MFFHIFISINIVMDSIDRLVRNRLLLEKRIGQVFSKIEIEFAFDIDRTRHAYDRSIRTNIDDYNQKEISNGEIVYAIELTKKEIARQIAVGLIKSEIPFIIKSASKELSLAINPVQIFESYWKLYVLTNFRESKHNPFYTGEDQIIIEF